MRSVFLGRQKANLQAHFGGRHVKQFSLLMQNCFTWATACLPQGGERSFTVQMEENNRRRAFDATEYNMESKRDFAGESAAESLDKPANLAADRKRRSTRDPRKPSPANQLFASLRPKNPVGDLFYSLGLFAECWVLHIGRFLRDSAIFFGQIFVWLFGDVISKIFTFI